MLTSASDPFWHLVLIACLIGIASAVATGGLWQLARYLYDRHVARRPLGGRR